MNIETLLNDDTFSIFWFTNHENGETYKIFPSGNVEWSKENKKGFTIANKTHVLRMIGYEQGYNAAKSDFERTGTMRSVGFSHIDPPNSEISSAAISEAIGET
jgi:hypothetical protein